MSTLVSYKQIVQAEGELKFDSPWEIIKYNSELWGVTLWVECMRQWFVILCTLALCALLSVSIHKLKRTQRGFDFDQFILVTELIKVVIFAVIEFFLLQYAGLVFCNLI